MFPAPEGLVACPSFMIWRLINLNETKAIKYTFIEATLVWIGHTEGVQFQFYYPKILIKVEGWASLNRLIVKLHTLYYFYSISVDQIRTFTSKIKLFCLKHSLSTRVGCYVSALSNT